MDNNELLLKAERIESKLVRNPGIVFDGYFTIGGERIISISSPRLKGSVLITLHPEGEAWCNVKLAGRTRRAWYSDADELPDGFIHEAVNELYVCHISGYEGDV